MRIEVLNAHTFLKTTNLQIVCIYNIGHYTNFKNLHFNIYIFLLYLILKDVGKDSVK